MYYAAQDVAEYLMSSYGGGSQDSEHRALRAAVHHAYRDLCTCRDWLWHVSEGTVAGTGSFVLPEGVRNLDALIPPQTVSTPTIYVSPADWNRLNTKLPTLDSPVYWTVVRSPLHADRWLLKLAGAPASTTYSYTYRRLPSPIRYMGLDPAVRAPGFAPAGAVRRYGTATHFPESLAGIHPYTAQEVIGLAGSMQGTAPVGALTAVSDFLDISSTMYTALLSGSEMWMARLLGKNVEGAMTVYSKDLRMACEADVVVPLSGLRSGAYDVSVARALGYYSPSGPDTGV